MATSSNRPSGTGKGTSRAERSTSRTKSALFGSFTADSAEDREALAGADTTSTATAPKSGAARRSPRRIRLTLARLDPFSVMKLSFIVALALGIATIVCTALLWGVVDGIGLWDKLDSLGRDLNSNKPLPFMEFFSFSKMISYSVLVAFLNLVIITALGTLFSFLYNIVAGLIGGLKMTFTDE